LGDPGALAGGRGSLSAAPFELLIEGEVRRILVEFSDDKVVLREGNNVLEAGIRRISTNELRLRLKDRSVRVFLTRDEDRTFVALDGRQYVVAESRDEPGRDGGGEDRAAGSLRIKAPMPGKVTKIAVSVGEAVRKNQTLVIVEAMKMENEIKTSIDGVVTKIQTAIGDLVDAEKTLVEVEKR
jgi:biotin carboxyl carrier protein